MNKTKEYPLVPRWRFIKHARTLIHNPVPVILSNMREFGDTYTFHIGMKTMGMVSSDAELCKYILQKNHKNFHKSSMQSEELASYVGKGLLTSNGNAWLRQRQLIQPAFHKTKINSMVELMQETCAEVVENSLGEKTKIFSAYDLSMKLTFSIIAKTMFTDEMNEEDLWKLRAAIDKVQRMLILQVRQPYLRWYYNLSGKIKEHIKIAESAKQIVRNKVEGRMASGLIKNDMLQFLMDCRYQPETENVAPLGMSVDQLVDELIILLVAGHETTAHALSWTLGLLTMHPEWIEEVQDELDAEQIMSPKIMAIINESLRLYPPAWVADRVVLEDDEFDGHKIPKDTIFLNFIYGIHRNGKYWDKPNEFNPNRFLDRTEIVSFSFIPFGGGPRKCIGAHFSMLELAVCLRYVLQNYTIKNLEDKLPGINPLITLHPITPIQLEFTRK